MRQLGAVLETQPSLRFVLIWETTGNDPDAARVATLELLEAHPETTALLCFADQLAIAAQAQR